MMSLEEGYEEGRRDSRDQTAGRKAEEKKSKQIKNVFFKSIYKDLKCCCLETKTS